MSNNTNEKIFFTRRTSLEEYKTYASNDLQYIQIDDQHKIEYILPNNEIVRRIINGYDQWTEYGVSNKGNVYNIDAGMIPIEKRTYKFSSEKNKPYYGVPIGIPTKSIFSKKQVVEYSGNALIGVHRLVVDAFIEHVPGYMIADHINEDRLDNNLDNLRRTNVSGNMKAFIINRYDEDPYYFYKNKRADELSSSVELACQLLEENSLPLSKICEKTNLDPRVIRYILKDVTYKDITSKYNIKDYSVYEIVTDMSEHFKSLVDSYLRRGYSITKIIFDFQIDDINGKFRKNIEDRKFHLITDGYVDDKYLYSNEKENKRIEELIRLGYKPTVISEMMDKPNDYIYAKHIAYIRKQLMDKEGYIEFNDVQSTRDNNPLFSKNYDPVIKDVQTVHNICKLLEENKLTQGEIAKLLNVSKITVRTIKNEQAWISVSVNYDIQNHEKHECRHEYNTKENRKKIRELLDKGYRIIDICKELGYPNINTHGNDETRKVYKFVEYQKKKYKLELADQS